MNKDAGGLLDTKFVEEADCKIVLGDMVQSVGSVYMGDLANYATVNIDGSGTFEVGNIKFGDNLNIVDLNDDKL